MNLPAEKSKEGEVKKKLMEDMSHSDITLVSILEGVLRFAAVIEIMDDRSLEGAEARLKQWINEAERDGAMLERDFFAAARDLVRGCKEG